ncbi:type II toxin-antitoxin system CcdA family antitoxin [Bowmanella denitrificans]|uniref:type II toxin-antitoxin system CcdA family antitoxin n=1 Tax=Bowmanella denitrificans TaxID=366582 RepID=UPI000C9CB74C|nr:type II toxin-antitoxin system CcdA family antitoxin [Bowmanella denitrificans]
MRELFDKDAPKKATNLSINSSLLAEAKSLKVNLSATMERALEAEVRQSKRRAWQAENKQAIENCNTLAEANGLFADKHRGF